MIIDVHAHVFPHFGGPHGNLVLDQNMVRSRWGRMRTNTLDEKYIPNSSENVEFRVGKFGKFYWNKHGLECWMQRFPTMMKEMEWPPENMIAFMDSVGVDKAILQAGYMDMNYCYKYFSDCIKEWPDRFIGTINLDYDIEKRKEHQESELEKLRFSVDDVDMRGVFRGYPKRFNSRIDDVKFDPYWEELSRLKIPQFFTRSGRITNTRKEYLDILRGIKEVLTKFPKVVGILGHLGGNVRHPKDPNYTDTAQVLLPILRLPNAYFEVGYTLIYNNWDVWGKKYEYPYYLHEKLVKTIYDDVGAEKLLWGSDMPNIFRTCTYQQALDLVRLHLDFLTKNEKKLILGGNSAKLFKI